MSSFIMGKGSFLKRVTSYVEDIPRKKTKLRLHQKGTIRPSYRAGVSRVSLLRLFSEGKGLPPSSFRK